MEFKNDVQNPNIFLNRYWTGSDMSHDMLCIPCCQEDICIVHKQDQYICTSWSPHLAFAGLVFRIVSFIILNFIMRRDHPSAQKPSTFTSVMNLGVKLNRVKESG